MGSNEAENYHVGLVTTDFDFAIKFISEHLVYGDNHQWCNHIYNRVHDMEIWEDNSIQGVYGLSKSHRINQIGEKETLTVEALKEDVLQALDLKF